MQQPQISSNRESLRPVVREMFFNIVKELYDTKEAAANYARQTEELVYQQSIDDDSYMRNVQIRTNELKELSQKFRNASANPAAQAQQTQNPVNQAQAAQRLYLAQMKQMNPIGQEDGMPFPQMNALSSTTSPILAVGGASAAAALTSSVPATVVTSSSSKKRQNPGSTSAPATSSVQTAAVDASKRRKSTSSVQNVMHMINYIAETEAKIRASYQHAESIGRQVPVNRTEFESILQELKFVKTDLENDHSRLTEESFQKSVHAVYKKIQLIFKPASAASTTLQASTTASASPLAPEMQASASGIDGLSQARVRQNPLSATPITTSAIGAASGIQGFQLLLSSKQSMIDSSKAMSDLVNFHDSKQGFNLRTQLEETKRPSSSEAIPKNQSVVYTVGAIASPHAPQSPYGYIASPGMPTASTIQSAAAAVRSTPASQIGMIPVQPIGLNVASPVSTPASLGISSLGQSASVVDTYLSDVYANQQRSPLPTTASVQANGIIPRVDRLTLQQEFLKIKELELLTVVQVPGQNTRWSLYSFDIRRSGNQVLLPSLLVGIRADYESLDVNPTADMMDYRVQKGKSDTTEENTAILQQVLKQRMTSEQPRLYNLITQWLNILTTVYTS